MKLLESENTGVKFLVDNMASKQFAQTLLGFNTNVRMVLDAQSQELNIAFECAQFKSWGDAVGVEDIEAKVSEYVGSVDGKVSMENSGYTVVIPCPDGVSDEVKNVAANLRDKTYQAVITAAFEKAPDHTSNYSDGLAIKINRKCTAFISNGDGTKICSYLFQEPESEMERALQAVFLQEFKPASRKIKGAPAVTYHKDDQVPILALSFQGRALNNMEKVASTIYSIPDNLDFHLKSSKTYFHHNMHTQVKDWLTVLNSADPQKAAGAKKKKQRRSLRS